MFQAFQSLLANTGRPESRRMVPARRSGRSTGRPSWWAARHNAPVGFDSFAQRPRDGLERRLQHVVDVFSRQLAHVQGHAGVRGERDEKELLGQRCVERSQHNGRNVHVPVQLPAPRKVARRQHQRLVHGKHERPKQQCRACRQSARGERLPHACRHPPPYGAVHFQVALDAYLQIEQPMPPKRAQHVVKNPMPVSTSARPVPSRSTDSLMSVSFVTRARPAHVACPARP